MDILEIERKLTQNTKAKIMEVKEEGKDNKKEEEDKTNQPGNQGQNIGPPKDKEEKAEENNPQITFSKTQIEGIKNLLNE